MAERWNSGDVAGCLDLYHDDVVMTPSPRWPETVQLKGKEAFRKNTEEWLSAWGSVQIEADMPVHMVFTVRDGRIAHLEWFEDHDGAVAAARHA